MSQNLDLMWAVIGGVSSVAAFLWGVFTYAIPYYQSGQEKRLNIEKRNMGPYTENIISEAVKYYIKPKCCKTDPTHTYNNPNNRLPELDLFDEVDKFIDDVEYKKFLLVLADSGMGKTSFILNYYYNNKKLPNRKRQNIKLVSLSMPDADAYLLNDEINYEDTVIFLDAFDEDTKAINNYQERLLQLFRLCSRYKKVIVTCRSQFFVRENDIPRATDIPRIGPAFAGSIKNYMIDRLYLLPFNTDDIEAYLNKRYPKLKEDKKALALVIVSKIPSLSMRPMLLAYVPELLNSDITVKSTFSLFEIMIDGWLKRESVWVDEDLLGEFSEKLAVDIYKNRRGRGQESVTKDELIKLSKNWELKIDNWQLTGRSLLNRDANDNYKFAHRSIMEFLFVKRLLKKDRDCNWIDLTDQMIAFVGEHLSWTKYSKYLVHGSVKFLNVELLWKIFKNRQSLSEENYFEFTKIFDGLRFLNLTGYFLSGLENSRHSREFDISKLAWEFDRIIEKEGFGRLSYQDEFSILDDFERGFPVSKRDELFSSVVSLLARDLKVKEDLIRNSLVVRANHAGFLQMSKSYSESFDRSKLNLSVMDLLIENVKLYNNGILAVPLFDNNCLFSGYVLLTFKNFDGD